MIRKVSRAPRYTCRFETSCMAAGFHASERNSGVTFSPTTTSGRNGRTLLHRRNTSRDPAELVESLTSILGTRITYSERILYMQDRQQLTGKQTMRWGASLSVQNPALLVAKHPIERQSTSHPQPLSYARHPDRTIELRLRFKSLNDGLRSHKLENCQPA